MPKNSEASPLRVAFATLGCKLNFAETSAIQSTLPYTIVPFTSEADVYVINTCTVTDAADKKGRNLISKARRTAPGAKIVVMGCQSQVNADAMAQLPGVSLVVGNAEKFDLNRWLEALSGNRLDGLVKVTPRNEIRDFFPAVSYGGRTRCFIKVQDGCDHFCAYCIVPYARGKSRNAPIASVIEQIRAAEARGVKEMVITGVNIGDFGRSTGETLTGLLHSILTNTTVPRIRLGSVEPELLSDEIIEMVAHGTRLMPHFHLPLQSGCDETLQRMKRKYDIALVSDRIQRIRKAIPHAFIGADVIAGFPGETDAHFSETIRFLKSQYLSALHVFPYSLRKGTLAAGMPDQIAHEVKETRKKELLALSEEMKKHFFEKNLGRTHEMLVERISADGKAEGFSANYIPVFLERLERNQKNAIVSVRLTGITEDGKMKGECV